MKSAFGLRRLAVLILAVLLVYLSLFTWNLETGVLDKLAVNSGLEFTLGILRPAQWVVDKVEEGWDRYVYLVGVREENEVLQSSITKLTFENAQLRERAATSKRLEHLLGFTTPSVWGVKGARVVTHRLGPAGALETILIDRGATSGITDDAPVVVPNGVVGRVLRTAPHASTILLLSDPNSRLAVLGRKSRTTGILSGQGPGNMLSVNYVPLNAPLAVGEILVTSGLAGIYPKGLPVARVVSIERSSISLFQTAEAEPLIEMRNLEEVLILHKDVEEVVNQDNLLVIGNGTHPVPGNATAGNATNPATLSATNSTGG